MDLETTEVVQSAYLLTNIPGVHSLTTWRAYNEGAVIEQRIEELKQLSAGQTAVDDLGGNHLLWALSGLAYQLFHTLRRQLPASSRCRPGSPPTATTGGCIWPRRSSATGCCPAP